MAEMFDGKLKLRGGFGANRLAIVWGEVARCGWYWRLKFKWATLLVIAGRWKRPRTWKRGRRLVNRVTEAMMAVFSVNSSE